MNFPELSEGLAIYVSPIENSLQIHSSFLKKLGLLFSWLFVFLSSCVFWILILLDTQLAKRPCGSVGFPIPRFAVSLAMQTLFSFVRSHLSVAGLSSWTNRVLFRKSSPCGFFGAVVAILEELQSGVASMEIT